MSEQHRPNQASTTTAVASPGTPARDDIFLSPRVVDRQAFAEFAAQLRSLIDDAALQGETLRAAAEGAQRTRDSLHDAVNANQMKLDMATRALATIDQKSEQTRRLIEGASDITTRIDDFRRQADQVIQERTGILCQRLNEAEEASIAQVESLHRRLAELERTAAEREQTLRTLVEGLSERADRLADLVERAEAQSNSSSGLGSMLGRADDAARAAVRAVSDLQNVSSQADQARQILAQALNAAVPIIDDASTVQENLEHAVSQSVRMTESAKTSLASDAHAHAERIARAVQEAATARDAAQTATTSAQDAARRLEALLQQVTPWRRVLLGETEDAPVGAAISGMVVELKKELRGVAGALRSLAERTETAVG